MAERLRCRKGHRWTPSFPQDAWPPDFRSSCPTCGGPPLAPYDMTATTAGVLTALTIVFLVAGVGLLFLPDVMILFGVVLLVFSGVIPLIALGVWVARQRTKKMAAVAEQMGFAFLPSLTVTSLRAVAPFRLFTHGTAQKAYNAMQGRVGDCDLLYFEYQYTIPSGEHSQTFLHSAVILFDAGAGVPDFLLTPKTFFDKLVGFFTQAGVELEDAGEFAKRCKLTGPDEAALRKTFHPELVHYLAEHGRWFIQAYDSQLLLYRTPRLAPDRGPGLVTDALEVRDMLRGKSRPTE